MTLVDELLELAQQQSEYIQAMLDLCADWKSANDDLLQTLVEDQPEEGENYHKPYSGGIEYTT